MSRASRIAIVYPLILCTQTGVCVQELLAHDDIITALEWLPDGTGFLSAGMDSRIRFWVSGNTLHVHSTFLTPRAPSQDSQGKQRDTWDDIAIRITGLAVAPDGSRLVAIGSSRTAIPVQPDELHEVEGSSPPPSAATGPIVQQFEKRFMVWDLADKRLEVCVDS